MGERRVRKGPKVTVPHKKVMHVLAKVVLWLEAAQADPVHSFSDQGQG